MGTTGGPLVANYRVSAGRLPETHWYKDRRQGGRLLGEVCHFIDLTNWIVGSPPVRVFAAGSVVGESLLQDDVVVPVHSADRSIAPVSYAANGHGAKSTDPLGLLARGHSFLTSNLPN